VQADADELFGSDIAPRAEAFTAWVMVDAPARMGVARPVVFNVAD